MAYPKYFTLFNNLEYPIRMNRAGLTDDITIKDYFRLSKVRDDLYMDDSMFDPYTIRNGERPDQVARDWYGNEGYYWIILQVNQIIDAYQDWPMSSWEMDEYVLKKYGSHQAAGEVHHYETVPAYDKEGNLVMPGRGTPSLERGGRAQNGKWVPPNFEYTYPTYPGSDVYITRKGISGPLPSCIEISNRQYEYDINENKSQIYILQKKYLPNYLREVSAYSRDVLRVNNNMEYYY